MRLGGDLVEPQYGSFRDLYVGVNIIYIWPNHDCMMAVLWSDGGGRSMVVFRVNASAAIDPSRRSSPCLACANGWATCTYYHTCSDVRGPWRWPCRLPRTLVAIAIIIEP